MEGDPVKGMGMKGNPAKEMWTKRNLSERTRNEGNPGKIRGRLLALFLCEV